MDNQQQVEQTIRNSDRFLTAFHRIEQSMKEIIGTNDHLSFYKLVELSKRKNAIVRRYEEDLKEYATLRNAIVHHQTSTEYAIAEPHDEIVQALETIDEALAKPVTVGEMFERKVSTLQAKDTLREALIMIRDKQFTQIPVYDDHVFVGLLTAVGITFWLANHVENEDISWEMTVESTLQHEKKKENHLFVPREMSIFEAEELFKDAMAKGKRLEALLITDKDGLVGIVTPLDLMKIEA
ncbi:CBS domain-containing protein [Paenisporosarcina quisquiliarum]|uniref:CBS domain-containing protein n=1 Tax=Paenisporosarcina quisquiliarum TaxID=365346 RepID=A0A9X3REI1_9BACL|nr:CBS domain-containing protein [Paenisporosarcina quisquiliarum]MCZ8537557.1 CBS domain-containing protein [Paenisporosarcina quisquiliarum]